MTASPSQLLLPNPDGGGYFQFWSKNRSQKHEKRAILHTLQANRESSSPRTPPATLLPLFANDFTHSVDRPKVSAKYNEYCK